MEHEKSIDIPELNTFFGDPVEKRIVVQKTIRMLYFLEARLGKNDVEEIEDYFWNPISEILNRNHELEMEIPELFSAWLELKKSNGKKKENFINALKKLLDLSRLSPSRTYAHPQH